MKIHSPTTSRSLFFWGLGFALVHFSIVFLSFIGFPPVLIDFKGFHWLSDAQFSSILHWFHVFLSFSLVSAGSKSQQGEKPKAKSQEKECPKKIALKKPPFLNVALRLSEVTIQTAVKRDVHGPEPALAGKKQAQVAHAIISLAQWQTMYVFAEHIHLGLYIRIILKHLCTSRVPNCLQKLKQEKNRNC